MVVVDRPGFAGSEPAVCVPDIRLQALALSPLLQAAPGQKILLVGQSYGAAIATLMADANPGKVETLVLLSGFFGEAGPTARWLMDLGGRALKMIPRDLRHAVMETTGQAAQLDLAKRALGRLGIPVHMVHGDQDDFAPIEVAERLSSEVMTRRPIRFVRTPGANHFLNDGPAGVLLQALESCIPPKKPWTFRWPQMPAFRVPRLPALRLGADIQQA
jgi:pimeloyl-ACP methyl ester carboxylesterase